MFISTSNRTYDWSNFTLILPTVSVGNVGQLAADLVVSTLWMQRIGYISHPSLLPCVGNNPFAHEDATSCKMTTCCEVYESMASEVVVVQQRAPFIKGRRKQYAEWLCNWIKESNFLQVVVLTSTFAQERLDYQMTGSPFRVLYTQSMSDVWGDFFCNKMEWRQLERRASFPAPAPHQLESQDADSQKLLYMPGSGIAKNIFENCLDLRLLVLSMFVSEGDNAQDAVDMADQINQWLSLISKREAKSQELQAQHVAKGIKSWKIPSSWRLVFGSKFDQKLYQ